MITLIMLIMASSKGQINFVEILLKIDINLNHQDHNGNSFHLKLNWREQTKIILEKFIFLFKIIKLVVKK